MKKNILLTALILVLNALPGGSMRCNAGARPVGDLTILENGVYFNGKIFVPFKEMILKDGKIFSIQSTESKTKGHRIPLNGKYVIPGLIDGHEHISGSPAKPYVFADPKLNANSNLNCGVTTLIDLFYVEDGVKAIKEETTKSPELYSSLIMSGPILTAPGGHGTEYGIPTRTITSVAAAKKITAEVLDGGADVIKLVYEADTSNYIPSITKEMVSAIVAIAHSRNKKVFAHIDRAEQAMACVAAGVDILAHMPCDLLTDAQLKRLKASGTIIIPTISVFQSHYEGHDATYLSDPLLWKTANPVYMEQFSRAALPKPSVPESWLHKYYPEFKWRENLEHCIKMNIPILAGTDAGNYAVFFGYSLHNELLTYTQAGMNNAQALCTATENIGLVFPKMMIGKIEAGYDADLVVLNDDPLKDIRNTESINMVFHEGAIANMILMAQPAEEKIKPIVFAPAVLDISNAEQLPANFSTYSDAMGGGTSTIHAELREEPTGKKYVHLTGKVIMKGYLGFAGAGFGLGMNNEAADISDYKAVEFDVKGNGEDYVISLVSSLVKDHNYHSTTYKTSNDWQTVRILFGDTKQNPYYGKQIALDLKTIKGISFTASGKDMDIDLSIKNIHLVKQ